MWHEPPFHKPFYCRGWFLTLTAALFLGTLAVIAGGIYLDQEYATKANALDLSKLQDMESASIVYDRNGEVLGKIHKENRDTIAIDDMPFDLMQALVAKEDSQFYEHHGVSYRGIARALLKNWRADGIREGASTITQQLARNSFRDVLPASDRSFHRKLLEAFVAMRIEKNCTKAQILELYLNRVYFGSGFYGAEAAARGYFGKPAKELTLSECAMLAGLLSNPNNYSPWSNRQKCVEKRNLVLGRMLELGLIKKDRYDAAIDEALDIKNRGSIYRESYAVEFVRQQVASLIGDDDSVYGDGFRIYTTLDAGLQRAAETALKTRLEQVEQRHEFDSQQHQTFDKYDALFRQHHKHADSTPLPAPAYLQGAIYAMDNATGGVLALVGGRDFGHNQFNRALSSNRRPGTAFLPFVYAAAFEKGIFPGTLFQDEGIDNRQVMIGGQTGILGEWGQESDDIHWEGPISAHSALVKSKNAATVRVGNKTGIDNVLAVAKKAGIENELRRFPATYLGNSEVNLADLTLAFSIFPGAGSRPSAAYVIERVEMKNGKVLYAQADHERVSVVQPTTAYEVHTALAESLERGSADKAFTTYGLKRLPLGGKTGTAYNFTDAWFIGYSSAITCGVWAGFDSPQPIFHGAFSNQIALPIWVDFMNASFAKYQAQEIPQPAGLQKYEICRSSGLLATNDCVEKGSDGQPDRRTTYFELGTPAQAPKETCDVHGAPGQTHVLKPPSSGETAVRPELAFDPGNFTPVHMKGFTVIGEDPYGSLRSNKVLKAPPVNPSAATGETSAPVASTPQSKEPQVRQAEPAGPMDHPAESQKIELEAPPPVQF